MLRPFDVPAGSRAALGEGLSRVLGDGTLADQLGRSLRPEQITATAPHPVTLMPVDELVDDFRPVEPVSRTWRYLLEVDRRVVASAHTTADDGGHRFGGVTVGGYVPGTAAAIRTVDELLQAAQDDHRFAVLTIPALQLMLLWLVSATAARPDLFLPVAPAPTGLGTARPYERSQIRDVIVSQARRTVADYQAGGPRLGG